MAQGVPVSYFEYVVTNPDNTARQSFKALNLLFEKVMDWVKMSGYAVCFARLNSSGLKKMYKRHGFKEGDKLEDMVWLPQH